jgi:hypothetical protein
MLVLPPNNLLSEFVTSVGAYPVFKINFIFVIPTLRIHSNKTTLLLLKLLLSFLLVLLQDLIPVV